MDESVGRCRAGPGICALVRTVERDTRACAEAGVLAAWSHAHRCGVGPPDEGCHVGSFGQQIRHAQFHSTSRNDFIALEHALVQQHDKKPVIVARARHQSGSSKRECRWIDEDRGSARIDRMRMEERKIGKEGGGKWYTLGYEDL